VQRDPGRRRCEAASDYTRFLDDLVTEASHSWTKNKYWAHSMINGIVRTTDSAGRPTKITSGFQYYPAKSQNSMVTLTLKAGVPECLYFEAVGAAVPLVWPFGRYCFGSTASPVRIQS
jgi:hypothetical protein